MMITQHLEFGEDITIRPYEKEAMCLLSHDAGICVFCFRRVFFLCSPRFILLVDISGSVDESGRYILKIRKRHPFLSQL